MIALNLTTPPPILFTNNTSNSSIVSRYTDKQIWDIARFSITVTMAAVILLANMIVTCGYVSMKTNDRNKISNYCLFHQSIVDIVVGVTFIVYELFVSNVLTPPDVLMSSLPITVEQFEVVMWTKFVFKPFTVLLCVGTLLMNTVDR